MQLDESRPKSKSLLDNAFPPSVDEKQKQDIIKAFESSLLNLFGLRERPKPNRDLKIPQYVLDLYNKHSDDPDSLSDSLTVKRRGVGSANTVRSFFHKGTFISHIIMWNNAKNKQLCNFKTIYLVIQDSLHRGNLYILHK